MNGATIHFYDMGIGKQDHTNNKKWKMRRFSTFYQELDVKDPYHKVNNSTHQLLKVWKVARV